MCYFFQAPETKKLPERYKTKNSVDIKLPRELNGFAHPDTAIISNSNPSELQIAKWDWSPDLPKYNMLNARIETVNSKPSFKSYIEQRCLIPASAFYEWQWLNKSGSDKQKYSLFIPEQEIFSFAGLWKEYQDKENGINYLVYVILTTKANDYMATIHNRKPDDPRMPIIIQPQSEVEWLNAGKIDMYNDKLSGVAQVN